MTINNQMERTSALKSAQALYDRAKAAARSLTSDERQRVQATVDDIKAFDAKCSEQGPTLLDQINAAAGGGQTVPGVDGARGGFGSDRTQFLDLGAKLTNNLATKMRETGGPETKGLAPNGQTVVGTPLLDQPPIEMARPLTTLLEAIPVVQRAPVYDYLRQTTRTMNAAPVAPGGLKPTSPLGVSKESNRLRVVAHLSEPIDKYMLADNSNLQTWVGTELVGGLREALETQVLSGDGTGENFTGLNGTSGIQTVAAGADRLVTLQGGVTALETVGQVPSVFIVSATDWQTIITTRNTSGAFDMGGAVEAATRRAWGVPVAIASGVPAGTAWLLGQGAVQLGTDGQGVVTEWGTPGDTFTKNQVVARTEGRFSLDVLRPMGVAKITLVGA